MEYTRKKSPGRQQNWQVAAARQRSEAGGHAATEGPWGWEALSEHKRKESANFRERNAGDVARGRDKGCADMLSLCIRFPLVRCG